MRTKNYSLVIGSMLLVILLTNFGVFVAPAISHETVEQERTLCIEECQRRFLPAGYYDRMYFRCINGCENTYWEKWQKDMDKLKADQYCPPRLNTLSIANVTVTIKLIDEGITATSWDRPI